MTPNTVKGKITASTPESKKKNTKMKTTELFIYRVLVHGSWFYCLFAPRPCSADRPPQHPHLLPRTSRFFFSYFSFLAIKASSWCFSCISSYTTLDLFRGLCLFLPRIVCHSVWFPVHDRELVNSLFWTLTLCCVWVLPALCILAKNCSRYRYVLISGNMLLCDWFMDHMHEDRGGKEAQIERRQV